MSHYSEINIEINDEDCLVQALEELGFKGKVERHIMATGLFGYRGDMRAQKAHVIIRKANVGHASNDIGFEKQADGTYKAWISEYDAHKYNTKWLNKLKQGYSIAKIKKEVLKKGKRITHTMTQENGKIKVVIEV